MERRGGAAVDAEAPLLGTSRSRNGRSESGSGWRGGGGLGSNVVAGAARFFRQAGSRRVMRESSLVVRETVSEQLEERQSDWAYSRPVVVLDIIWNLVFILASAAVLALSVCEKNAVVLRVWVVGYALQCLLHMLCISLEYHSRRRRRNRSFQSQQQTNRSTSPDPPSEPASDSDDISEDGGEDSQDNTSWTKKLESANTMFSFIWWIVGCYWIATGGQALTHDSPYLYWLCVVFLAFDVFFVIFCVALACVIGIAVCCCLPCIIAILYAVVDQDGASDEHINTLPRYKFHVGSSFIWANAERCGGTMRLITETEESNERILSAEDAVCCICLASYDDNDELRKLPCNHHFHCACIDKWLRMNATCPLCKYNITDNYESGREDA